MDALARSRRPLLSALAGGLAGALAIACAAGGGGAAVGTSDKKALRTAAEDAGGDAGGGAAVALPSAYRTSFTKVNRTRFVSQGHAAGRWEVDVWANELAAKALAASAREVPPGAIVVQEHHERGADPGAERPSGPIMMMEKMPAGHAPSHGDWRWAVVGSQGQLVRDGVIESCAGCHDEAPMDGLFPILD